MAENGRFGGREVVIVEAARLPVGRGHEEKGYYKDVHASNLLARSYSAVIERAGIDPSQVVRYDQNTPPLPLPSTRPGAIAGALAGVNGYPPGGYVALRPKVYELARARYVDRVPGSAFASASRLDPIEYVLTR